MNSELKQLICAAYLHDIGKFWQRVGKKSGTHAEWSQKFVLEYLQDEMIASLVGAHHNISMIVKKEWERLESIITDADHLSAGHDRTDRDNDEKGDPKKEGLKCIFEKIFNQSAECSRIYPLKPLDFSEDQYPVDSKEYLRRNYTTDLRQLYEKHWNAFVSEWKEIGRPNINQLDALLKKYTSCIPSAVYVNEPDIPLYDHCKTTAAIASCLYFSQREENAFLLIEGDLSGIQNFIFDVASPADARKGMAKRLRGRSFWLGLLTRAVSDVLLQQVGLSKANLLWNTGGKFVILAPNTLEIKDLVSKMDGLINSALLSKFSGKLYLAFGMLEFGKKRFSESFDRLLGDLNEMIAEKKLRKFSGCSVSFDAVGEVVANEEFCPVCGMGLEHGSCPACSLFEAVGKKIASARYLIRAVGGKCPFDFTQFGLDTSYDLISDDLFPKHDGEVYHINDTQLGKSISGFLVIGNTVPKVGNEIFTFGDLASLSKGDEKLGVFKADMDRLGKIMSVGLPKGERSISRIHTLSSRIEHFFCGIVNSLCAANPVYLYEHEIPDARKVQLESGQSVWVPNNVSDEMEGTAISPLYIVYAGGDDLLIVGPYDKIVLFADLFYRKFREYVCYNKDITLSAGIAVSHPKKPIVFSVLSANEQLDIAKQSGRNRVCLLGECLLWDAVGTHECGFEKLLRQGERLEEYVEKGVVTRSLVNSLSILWVQHFGNKPVEQRAVVRRYLPQMMYMLKRNVTDTQIREELRSTMCPTFSWMQLPIQWALMRTRRVLR